MNQSQYSNALEKYCVQQLENINSLKNIAIPEFSKLKVDCSKLDTEYRTKLLSLVNIEEKVLYYFSIESNPDKIQSTVNAMKKRKRNKYKLPMVNTNSAASKILYVGKTNNNFKTRLEQHLGYKSPGTYSLHLSQWAVDLGLKLELNYAQIDLPNDRIMLLEQIENVLHQALKPLLGRSGH